MGLSAYRHCISARIKSYLDIQSFESFICEIGSPSHNTYNIKCEVKVGLTMHLKPAAKIPGCPTLCSGAIRSLHNFFGTRNLQQHHVQVSQQHLQPQCLTSTSAKPSTTRISMFQCALPSP